MKKEFTIIVILFASISILAQNNNYVTFKGDILVDKNNIPINSSQYYFPIELFREFPIKKTIIEKPKCRECKETEKYFQFSYDTIAGKTIIDSSDLKWYSGYLYKMKEPLLCNKDYNKEGYRFIWLRSFHRPIVIRIEKNDTLVYLIAKVYYGASAYKIRQKNKIDTIKLKTEDWTLFNNEIAKINFWKMSTKSEELTIGLDGAEWILEGRLGNKYNVVDRWSPYRERDLNFRKLCEILIKKSKLHLKKSEIY